VVDRLHQVRVACRGPKPTAVMRRFGFPVQILPAKPHTTTELLDALALAAEDVQNVGTLLVHYGERSTRLADALRHRGARLEEVCPYEWALPDDLAPIRSVIHDAIDGRLRAMLFKQIQCRHLFCGRT
jgi:uroporphyrinogen-III synthase